MTSRNRQVTAIIDGEVYYAAQKAREILGMTYSAVRNQVISGNIVAKTPRGRRQLYYRASDVENLSKEINRNAVRRRNKVTQFLQVKSVEEMKECLEISRALFGSARGSDVTKHMKVLEKNPETYYMIKDEDQSIGYTAIWPVKPGKLNNILAQTIPIKMPSEDIEAFQKGKTIDIYVNVIGIKPGFTKEEKRSYGARLISGLIDVIVKLGERGVPIDTIAARSNMPDGIRLLKGIGFSEIEPLTPERRTFIIDIKESGIPFVRQYKQALNNSKTLI